VRGLLTSGLATWPILARFLAGSTRPAVLVAWAATLESSWASPDPSRWPAREELLRAARRLAPVDPSGATRLHNALVRSMLLRGPRVEAWADEAVRAAEASGDGLRRAEAHLLRGAVRTLAGRLADARADLDEALSGPEPVATEASVRIGWWALFAHGPAEAIKSLEAARARTRDGGFSLLEAMAEVRLASAWHRAGRADRAHAHLERALGLYQASDEQVEAARCRANMAMMRVELGAPETARGPLQEALASDRAHGVSAAVPQHLLNLGEIELLTNRPAAARVVLDEATALAASFGDVDTHALALLMRGAADALLGEPDIAARRLAEARVRFQEARNPVGVGLAWAWLAVTTRDPAEAADASKRASDALSEGGAPGLAPLLACAAAAAALPDSAPILELLAHDPPDATSFVRIARAILSARLEPARARPRRR